MAPYLHDTDIGSQEVDQFNQNRTNCFLMHFYATLVAWLFGYLHQLIAFISRLPGTDLLSG